MPYVQVVYRDGRKPAYIFSMRSSGAMCLSDGNVARKLSRSQASVIVEEKNRMVAKLHKSEVWSVVDYTTPPKEQK